ncbi:hypothetical protein [Planktotalea sp.]|uniref:hypothetical protein n=1 Tax=Planktotalea sp. TaxID=2029877 RepID=UPI003D6B1F2C
MAEDNAEITREKAIKAGVESYFHLDSVHGWSRDEKFAARSAIRTLMMRLGVYSDFVAALPDEAKRHD